ncbi:ABC-type transport auxiliary lipoprotein family protein [Lysobacter sp. A3-1-A15]|uniref:ABC-type transport auxiliary lipoprotein family protein n=1 Tax=Novilysobacter viscosus TaxID=3098602 RepID=UPI003982FB2B
MTSRVFVRSAAVIAMAALLAGCGVLGGGKRDRITIYAPDPRVQADPTWPAVDWQLSLTAPEADGMFDSLRIAVRPSPDELQVYKDANWAKRPSDMLQDTLLRALEDSGKIPAVARQGSGISADYKLVLDLRRFEADYPQPGGLPAATIEVNAKLLHAQDQKVVAARTFLHAEPADTTAIPDVVVAFDRSLTALGREMAGWILSTGQQHEVSAHD